MGVTTWKNLERGGDTPTELGQTPPQYVSTVGGALTFTMAPPHPAQRAARAAHRALASTGRTSAKQRASCVLRVCALHIVGMGRLRSFPLLPETLGLLEHHRSKQRALCLPDSHQQSTSYFGGTQGGGYMGVRRRLVESHFAPLTRLHLKHPDSMVRAFGAASIMARLHNPPPLGFRSPAPRNDRGDYTLVIYLSALLRTIFFTLYLK